MRVIDSEGKWDKKICLEFTLRELQILYDSIGEMSWNDYNTVYEKYSEIPKGKIPFNSSDVDILFEDLQDLIKLEGGYIE